MKRLLVKTALVCASLAVLPFAATASATTATTVSDAVGDTFPLQGPGSTPAAYFDIVDGSVAKQGHVFNLTIHVAGSVPAQPKLPTNASEVWWLLAFDTDPMTFPNGYPRGRGEGIALVPEFGAIVAWDGTRFRAFVVDRRPNLIGQDSVVTPTPFSIATNTVSLFVDEAQFGNPASFGFRVYTWAWNSKPGTEGVKNMDFAPDDFVWVPWES